jgi:hypothetical protein
MDSSTGSVPQTLLACARMTNLLVGDKQGTRRQKNNRRCLFGIVYIKSPAGRFGQIFFIDNESWRDTLCGLNFCENTNNSNQYMEVIRGLSLRCISKASA